MIHHLMYESVYAIFVHIWIFGGRWSRNEIWTKIACPDMVTFFEKITGFEIWKGFGCVLEHQNIWIFEHLNN